MQVTVTIPDELVAQVRESGMSVEAYIQGLVEQAQPKSRLFQRPQSREQIEGFFTAMAEGSERLPSLSTQSFTRESFYEDRR
jgi:hypothetical protein